MSSLNVEYLSCQRGYNQLFENLSFQLNSGELLRITGTNGSGKTSLLKILAGLSEAEQGRVTLGKYRVKSQQYQQAVLYLGHLPALSGELSCIENLEFLTGLNQPVERSKLTKVLGQIGLDGYENEYCEKLSAGQKRRVILTSLFVSNAKIWLLDEPFTALDLQGVAMIEKCISQHCKQGGICLFTTHQKCTLPNQKILAL